MKRRHERLKGRRKRRVRTRHVLDVLDQSKSEKVTNARYAVGGEMVEGERFLFPFVIMAEELGDKTILFSCKDCGYIELYKEMKEGKSS